MCHKRSIPPAAWQRKLELPPPWRDHDSGIDEPSPVWLHPVLVPAQPCRDVRDGAQAIVGGHGAKEPEVVGRKRPRRCLEHVPLQVLALPRRQAGASCPLHGFPLFAFTLLYSGTSSSARLEERISCRGDCPLRVARRNAGAVAIGRAHAPLKCREYPTFRGKVASAHGWEKREGLK